MWSYLTQVYIGAKINKIGKLSAKRKRKKYIKKIYMRSSPRRCQTNFSEGGAFLVDWPVAPPG